jgi:uncharacterized membrane protein
VRARKVFIPLLAWAVTLGAVPAFAQESEPGITLTTPFPAVSVQPGDDASFDVEVSSTVTQRVDLAVEGLPEGWTAQLRGGGFTVAAVIAGPEEPANLDLEVTVPADAAEGDYRLALVASGGSGAARLPIEITVSAGAAGSVTMTPEFPALQGPSDSQFRFDLTIDNDTPEELQLELAAQGPQGWRVEARPSGESQASTVTVDAGSTARIQVTANPRVGEAAGTYPLLVTATGSGHELAAELLVQLTGTFDLTLQTETEVLNVELGAGRPTDLGLLVVNTGTAPLVGVQLSATPPSGWEVKFTPEAVDVVEPGASVPVTATITPSSNAIAGDYRITFRANVDQADDSIELRGTVRPSQVAGLVGLGVILLTLLGLGWVFRRFGRR